MKRRLRKKLHLAEFRQFGFEVAVVLAGDPSAEDGDAFLDRFIVEAIEANRLSCAGGGGPRNWHFVTQPDVRYGGTEADRERVSAWLASQQPVAAYKVGPLIDLWNGPGPEEPLEVDGGERAA